MKDYLDELKSYNEAVFKDFLHQNVEVFSLSEYLRDKIFIEYLLSRMYHEGLPEREPVDIRKKYVKVD